MKFLGILAAKLNGEEFDLVGPIESRVSAIKQFFVRITKLSLHLMEVFNSQIKKLRRSLSLSGKLPLQLFLIVDPVVHLIRLS